MREFAAAGESNGALRFAYAPYIELLKLPCNSTDGRKDTQRSLSVGVAGARAMYQTYWGLRQSPFSAAAVRAAFVASPIHAEALARLDFVRENRLPLGLLLGPAGSGKSAVLAEFAHRAKRAGTAVAIAGAAGAEEVQLLSSLAIDLACSAEGDALQLWQRVTDRLQELKLEGLTAILLLDDLDRARPSSLALVERLLAFPDAQLVIVASARPETVGHIGSRVLDHAGLRIDLAAWNMDETRDYLQVSLAHAGRMQPAFDKAAVRRLFELSGGAPRRVNQLAELALVAGAGQKLTQIDADTIDAVQEELAVGR